MNAFIDHIFDATKVIVEVDLDDCLFLKMVEPGHLDVQIDHNCKVDLIDRFGKFFNGKPIIVSIDFKNGSGLLLFGFTLQMPIEVGCEVGQNLVNKLWAVNWYLSFLGNVPHQIIILVNVLLDLLEVDVEAHNQLLGLDERSERKSKFNNRIELQVGVCQQVLREIVNLHGQELVLHNW